MSTFKDKSLCILFFIIHCLNPDLGMQLLFVSLQTYSVHGIGNLLAPLPCEPQQHSCRPTHLQFIGHGVRQLVASFNAVAYVQFLCNLVSDPFWSSIARSVPTSALLFFGKKPCTMDLSIFLSVHSHHRPWRMAAPCNALHVRS